MKLTYAAGVACTRLCPRSAPPPTIAPHPSPKHKEEIKVNHPYFEGGSENRSKLNTTPFVSLFFFLVFSDISERNNDYSDTVDFRRG